MIAVRRAVVGALAVVALAVACTNITVPTIPPIELPSTDVGSQAPISGSACDLVTQDELTQIFGGAPTVSAESDGSCSITPPNQFVPMVLRYGEGESIAAGKLVAGNGQDLTVGGYPAYYGELFGGILYVEKNGQTLVAQAPLNNDAKDTLVAIATAAIARF